MMKSLVFVLALAGCTAASQTADISELLKLSPVPRPIPVRSMTAFGERSAMRAKTRYSLSELIEGAQNVIEADGYLKNIEKLEALVTQDWNKAEPILRKYLK